MMSIWHVDFDDVAASYRDPRPTLDVHGGSLKSLESNVGVKPVVSC